MYVEYFKTVIIVFICNVKKNILEKKTLLIAATS